MTQSIAAQGMKITIVRDGPYQGDTRPVRLRAIIRADGESVEPTLLPEIALVADPARGVAGRIWVRGGSHATDEVKFQDR